MESDRGIPASTSSRTNRTMSRRREFWVCSSSTMSALRTARPELIIVANWRAKIALSRGLMCLVPSRNLEKSNADFFSSRRSTVKPLRRSSETTAAFESATNSPLNGLLRSRLAV